MLGILNSSTAVSVDFSPVPEGLNIDAQSFKNSSMAESPHHSPRPPSSPLSRPHTYRRKHTLLRKNLLENLYQAFPEPCTPPTSPNPIGHLSDNLDSLVDNLEPNAKARQYKMNVLHEFIETEKSYSRSLKFFLNEKVKASAVDGELDKTLLEAVADSKALSSSERKFVLKIATELETIHQLSEKLIADLNTTFEPELDKAKDPSSPGNLKNNPLAALPSKSILKMEDDLIKSFDPRALELHYAKYILNQKKLLTILKKWEKSKPKSPTSPKEELTNEDANFNKSCKIFNKINRVSSPCTVSSFILLPFQRTSKYPLLLRELSKGDIEGEPNDQLKELHSQCLELITSVDNTLLKGKLSKKHREEKELLKEQLSNDTFSEETSSEDTPPKSFLAKPKNLLRRMSSKLNRTGH